jgi:hypothetical protein
MISSCTIYGIARRLIPLAFTIAAALYIPARSAAGPGACLFWRSDTGLLSRRGVFCAHFYTDSVTHYRHNQPIEIIVDNFICTCTRKLHRGGMTEPTANTAYLALYGDKMEVIRTLLASPYALECRNFKLDRPCPSIFPTRR